MAMNLKIVDEAPFVLLKPSLLIYTDSLTITTSLSPCSCRLNRRLNVLEIHV